MRTTQTHAVVESLDGKSRVHCILTVRDISRLVTAQWQTAMRSRRLWTLTDYCAAAATDTSTHPDAESMQDHFWIQTRLPSDPARGGSARWAQTTSRW